MTKTVVVLGTGASIGSGYQASGRTLPGDRGFFGNAIVQGRLDEYYALNIMLDIFRKNYGNELSSLGLEEVWTVLEFISKDVYKPLLDLSQKKKSWLEKITKAETLRDDEHCLTRFFRLNQSIPPDLEKIDMSLLASWDLRRLLSTVYGSVKAPEDNIYQALFEKFKIAKDNSTTIVCLNYDLILEDALTRAGIPWHYPHIETEIKRKTEGIPIIKPHGSLNWQFCGNEPRVSISTDYRLTPVAHESTGCNQFKEAMIIPPTQLKQAINVAETQTLEMQDLLSKLFSSMKDALVESSRAFLIGYSLPPTDNHLRTLFYQMNSQRNPLDFDDVYCCTWADGQEGEVFANISRYFKAKNYHFFERGFAEFVESKKI